MDRRTRRSSRIIIGLVTVLLLVANTLSPLLTQTAYADTDSYHSSINDKYYSAVFLRDCLAQMSDKSKLRGDLATVFSEYTQSGPGGAIPVHSVLIGKWLAPSSGTLQCNDPDSVNAAAASLGYKTPGYYLIAIGYTATTEHKDEICSGGYNTPQFCAPAQDYAVYTISGNDKANDIVNSNQQNVASRYYAYLSIFTNNCTINIPPESTDDTATQTQIYLDGEEYKTQDVQVGFPVETLTGPADLGGSTQNSVAKHTRDVPAINNYDYSGKNTTCGELLKTMNGIAGAVQKWDNNNPDNAIVTGGVMDIAGNKADCENNGGTWDTGTGTCSGLSDTAACTGGALGFFLCPLVDLSQAALDKFGPMIESLLIIQPMTAGSPQADALQAIWQIIVGISNLLLVIAFLIVIFSQATSIGLSAYGIKKMLPRIIAAAILINLSFFICSISVDIFNVIGGSVKGIISVGMNAVLGSTSASVTSWWDIGGGLLAWVGIAVAAEVALGLLGFLVPALIAGVLAMISLWMMVGLRQVLILLLIIVSPLAFAAMILPGTESLFKKWYKSFFGLLVMYPVIVAIMYGCALISAILLAGIDAI